MSTVRSKILLNSIRLVLVLLLNLIFYVLVVAAIAKASSLAYEYSYQIFGDVVVEEPPGTEVDFEVAKGESLRSIASKLEQKRLVVNRYTFYVRARIGTMEERSVKAGEYVLNTSMTYSEILEFITDVENSTTQSDGG